MGKDTLDVSYLLPVLGLGSQPERLQSVADAGFTHVVCLRDDRDESAEASAAGLELLSLPWSDHRSMRELLPSTLPRLLYFVDEALMDPANKVFIHCAAGIERTPLAAYVLLRANGYTDAAARSAIRKARPGALLGFLDANSYAIEQFLDSRSG